MSAARHNRGLFYHRDSGGQAEMTPGPYVEWAQKEAKRFKVSFDGTPQLIKQMMENRQCHSGDICLDYIVPGNKMTRDGLSALLSEAGKPEVTHLFVAARDRIARPDRAADGVELEDRLRALGCTLVFQNKVLGPLQQGRRRDLGETIGALCEYDQAGVFRQNHARKMILAQISLAKKGFSTGGRAPYGFRRWLANDRGDALRELLDGEVVRMPGHHVVWLPTAQNEVDVVQRILSMLPTMPATQVAATLTSEGVPTPNSGRYRTDHGVSHKTSESWHANTVTNIARNPLWVGIKRYGRRSIGDQLRYASTGPRELLPDEFRSQTTNEVRITVNADEDCILTQTSVRPIVSDEDHQLLVAELDRRGQSQRGKPRSRGSSVNPLGCRVIDMECGWPMYRIPYGKAYSYKCGKYQQSGGKACSSNRVEGPLLTSFVLQCIQQRLFSADNLQAIEAKLLKMAQSEGASGVAELQQSKAIQLELNDAVKEAELIESNLARATSEHQFRIIAKQLKANEERRQELGNRLAKIHAKEKERRTSEQEVADIMDQLRRLAMLASSEQGQAAAKELIDATDARVFLSFVSTTPKKRTFQKISHGVITFGSALPPIEIYTGPTARTRVDQSLESRRKQLPSTSQFPSFDEKENSIGNLSRAERI